MHFRFASPTKAMLLVAAGVPAFAALVASTSSAMFAPSDFARHITFSVSADGQTALGEASVTDGFPVPVRLSTDIQGFSYEDFEDAGGSDMLFTDASGNEIPFEIESWNPDGVSLVWVRVPSLDASTQFHAYYGGPANAQNGAALWSGYIGVWHMGENGGTAYDSTGHGLHGTPSGSVAASMVACAGAIGNGRVNRPGNSGSAWLAVPSYGSLNDDPAHFTVSGWFYQTDTGGGNSPRLVSRKKNYSSKDGWEIQSKAQNNNTETKLEIRGGSSKAPAVVVPSLLDHWTFLVFAYDGTTVRVYANGVSAGSGAIDKATENGYQIAIGNVSENGQGQYFVGYYDEVRLSAAVSSADRILADYVAADPGFLSASASEAMDDQAPKFNDPVVVRNQDGTFTFSVTMTAGAGSVYAVYDGGAAGAVTNLISASATPGTYTETPLNLAADQTYAFAAYGESPTGTKRFRPGSILHTGNLAVTALADANEYGLVPGAFRVSRADTSYDMEVAYTVSGTATEGQTYVALPGTVVIPAGATSADITVTPLMDGATTIDTTVVLSIAPGLYGVDANAASATVTIVNLVPPAGFNTWVATADGLASDAGNWSLGRVPAATDDILLDGRFSNADCEWDAGVNGLTATVASWTQTSGYSGTVVFDTEFDTYPDASFTEFTVTGSVVLDSGTWTHPVSLYNATKSQYSVADMRQLQRYRLRTTVGGALTIGPDAAIDASEKGYSQANGTVSGNIDSAHGGSSGSRSAYGNPKCPVDIGYFYHGNYGSDTPIGGGVVYLVCGDDVTVDGFISADGGAGTKGGAAGGSIYLSAPSVGGTGSIHASGTGSTKTGPGGRVAVITTTPVDLASLPITATAGTNPNSDGYGTGNGVGTVYLRDSTSTHGTLFVVGAVNKRTGPDAVTPVTDESDWTFDAVVVGGSGRLAIPSGMTLTLPNGLASVSASSGSNASYCGLLVKQGGAIAMGDGEQTIRGWTFQSEGPFTFPGDVVLADGANLGLFRMEATTTNVALRASYTINGNLTVPADCKLDVAQAFYAGSGNVARFNGAHGGWSLRSPAGHTNTYGSVFNPVTLGTAPNNRYYGGGSLQLTVLGTLALDGSISASGYRDNNDRDLTGSAGSLNIRAGELTGTGSITADGPEGRAGKVGGGGGGRIAVRLTNAGATVPDTVTLSAYGFYGKNASSTTTDYSSSPGSIYVQTAGTPEGQGTLYIKGNGDSTITATTPVVAYVDGDPVDAFKAVPVVVTGNAIAEVSATRLQLASLTLEEGSKIDLAGRTLVVNRAAFGSERVLPGTYHAADFAVTLPGYVVNTLPNVSAEENPDSARPDPGVLVVLGDATILLIR